MTKTKRWLIFFPIVQLHFKINILEKNTGVENPKNLCANQQI